MFISGCVSKPEAITGMVPNLIWAPDFFGPQEIWPQRNLGPKKFGGPCMKMHMMIFMLRPNISGTKFLGTKIARGPNFLGWFDLIIFFNFLVY